MADFLELAARVEAAAGPDVDLAMDIADFAESVGLLSIGMRIPDYTASLDAAMTLVPEGCDAHDLLIEAAASAWNAHCDFGSTIADIAPKFIRDLPRFICAAALKARHTQAGDAK